MTEAGVQENPVEITDIRQPNWRAASTRRSNVTEAVSTVPTTAGTRPQRIPVNGAAMAETLSTPVAIRGARATALRDRKPAAKATTSPGSIRNMVPIKNGTIAAVQTAKT